MTSETLEISRRITATSIPAGGLGFALDSTAAERAALRARFDLVDLPALQAILSLRRTGDSRVVADGRLTATAIQRCVVTLEPIPTEIDTPVSLVFEDPADSAGPMEMAEGGEARFDPVGEDPPEPIMGGVLELGEPLAQILSLALDPYPRKPDAAPVSTETGAAEAAPNPFAALARLKSTKD